ncbi:VCBS repeat-containing protein [bacterium]|nr:VCBS repeat-containing protein [bacterium]
MKEKKYIFGVFLLVVAIAFLTVKFWADPDDCVEYTNTFVESFDTTDYKDEVHSAVANWGRGYITLNQKGANFSVTEPSGMGAKIYVCDAGDFTGDGYPDLVGLDITHNPTSRLVLVRNHFEDANNDGVDDDGVIFQVDKSEKYDQFKNHIGPASITVADYNNDGLLDFFFYKDQDDDWSYDNFVAAMYINQGTADDPDFQPYNLYPNLDFTRAFMSAGIYANWAGDHFCSVDIDEDGDMDILAISQDKIFLIKSSLGSAPLDPGNFDVDDFTITELNYNEPTGFTSGRGGSSVDAADFDGDGDIDVIGGTVEDYAYLVYYENDGNGVFTRHEIPIPNDNCTGTVATCVTDFNHDGRLDIFGATDRWNAGNEARMWFMKNTGNVEGGTPQFDFRCLNNCQPILPDPHDVDMSAMLDYDQDGDMDVVLADANHSGDYYLVVNELAPVYVLYGEAWSDNISEELDPKRDAITKVQITNLEQGIEGFSAEGLSVEYYVSSNGKDWEFYKRYEGNEIHNDSNLPVHEFSHYGSSLKWKAILEAEEDEMPEYDDASFESPRIGEIEFEYTYVEKKEYSRTSVVTKVETEGGEKEKLMIAGTFYFPSWEGHLRAYDISSMSPQTTPYSELRTITRPDLDEPSGREIVPEGVTIKWDAGELLDSRDAPNRTIYTAVPDDSGLQGIEFTTGNVDTLKDNGLDDDNNDEEGLIQFVRGEDRDWKLGDINHSNPAVVGPPDSTPSLMGPGYEDFVTTWEDRQKVMYVGANDGMLHCFDVVTGEELWGYIPHNLIPKLNNMRGIDTANDTQYFVRDVYVDGSPVTADVFIDSDGDGSKEWTTILVCGQGPGKGSATGGGANYYFALDVTDPQDPKPLWEFTHEKMGETWSVPVVGKIIKDGDDTWVAFMGSGYDNVTGSEVEGNRFHAVDLNSGSELWGFNAPEVDTSGDWGNNIPVAIPGSPSAVDIDNDGYTDRIYVGDLEGRLWKVDVSSEFTGSDSWEEEVIYEDSHNYPIITKPAVWINPSNENNVPRLYFGTGGDDEAPDTATYSFIALKDKEIPEVEWFIGSHSELNLPKSKDKGDLVSGEKVWADPKISDYIVYFSTLTGDIESVNPCESLQGMGRLYARYIWAKGATVLGGTAFTTDSGDQESLQLEIKTRSAVTLGESTRAGGSRKREVYIQEYDSTVQRLEQRVGALLKIKSWREIYKIIK